VRTAGDFAVACQLSVSPPGGPVFQAIAGTLAAGGLELGAGGRTHVVYAESPGAGFSDVPLRHAWLDGAWKIESFAPAVPNARSIDVQLSAAIDGAGALHALYSAVGTGPQTPPPQYATNSSGSWVVETVSPTEGKVILWYSSPIAVRPDGTPAFIGASSTAMQLVVRGADGWYAQDIPGVALGNRSVAFLTPAPDSVLVLYDLYDAPQKLDSLKFIERTAAGWQAPMVLAT